MMESLFNNNLLKEINFRAIYQVTVLFTIKFSEIKIKNKKVNIKLHNNND